MVAFTACSRVPETLASALQPDAKRAPATELVIGLVTNIDDPLKIGRVKVKFPTLFDNDESTWARLVVPMAGHQRGFYAPPEVNDEVLVGFEGGDPNRPYVLGAVWSSKDVPPEGTADIIASGQVNQRIWRSKSGHLFVFDDTSGSEAIRIIDHTSGNRIIITSSDNKLEVTLDGDIEVTSKTGQISMKANKDIKIESETGKVSVVGVTTAFEAKQSGTMKTGTTMELQSGTSLAAKAGTSAEVTGNTSAKLSAAVVDVNGSGTTNIKGGLVNIN
jgi:uncharacterized protein involved in type VI secretion and phage assembly